MAEIETLDEAHELICRAVQLMTQRLVFFVDDWAEDDQCKFYQLVPDLKQWLHDYREPECPFADAVQVLEAFYYTDAELAEWLNAPHPQFGGKSAIQMLAEGKKQEVCACVRRLDDGVYL